MRVEGAALGRRQRSATASSKRLGGAVPGELVGRMRRPTRRTRLRSCGAPASSGRRRRRSGRSRQADRRDWIMRVVARRRRRRRARAAAGACSSSSRPIEEKPTPSISTLSPRRLSVMLLPALHAAARSASTVSGSSARRNSSAWSENTTPKPQVAPAGVLLEQLDLRRPGAASSRDRRNRARRGLRRSRRCARSSSQLTVYLQFWAD